MFHRFLVAKLDRSGVLCTQLVPQAELVDPSLSLLDRQRVSARQLVPTVDLVHYRSGHDCPSKLAGRLMGMPFFCFQTTSAVWSPRVTAEINSRLVSVSGFPTRRCCSYGSAGRHKRGQWLTKSYVRFVHCHSYLRKQCGARGHTCCIAILNGRQRDVSQ